MSLLSDKIIVFQGIFFPIPEYKTFLKCVDEEIISLINPLILSNYKNQVIAKNDLNFMSQIIHAINISKFHRYKEKETINYFSGFSMGIYSALYASGHISLTDSFNLIEKRANILMSFVDDKWDVYTLSGVKEEKISIILKSFQNNIYISTISSNRHYSIAIKRDFYNDIFNALKTIGYFKFEKVFINAAWHTKALIKSKHELTLLLNDLSLIKNNSKIIFTQNPNNDNIKQLLLDDNFNNVNFPNLVNYIKNNDLFPVFLDETESLEKIWYSNTKNTTYEVIKCVQL